MGLGKGNLVRAIVFGLVGQVMLGVLSVTELHAQESPIFVKVCKKTKQYPEGLRLDESTFMLEQDVLSGFLMHIKNLATTEGTRGSVNVRVRYNAEPRLTCDHTFTVPGSFAAADILPVSIWQVAKKCDGKALALFSDQPYDQNMDQADGGLKKMRL